MIFDGKTADFATDWAIRLSFEPATRWSTSTPRRASGPGANARTAAGKGIRIVPLAASGVDKELEFLLRLTAIATGGTYTFLTNDSGIGGDHIEPTIGEYQVEILNDLLVRVISAAVVDS